MLLIHELNLISGITEWVDRRRNLTQLKQPDRAFSPNCLKSKINSSICSTCFTVPYCCYASRTERGWQKETLGICWDGGCRDSCCQRSWSAVGWQSHIFSNSACPCKLFTQDNKNNVVWCYGQQEDKENLCMFVFIVTPDDRIWHIQV